MTQYNASEIILEDEDKINAIEFLRLLDKLYHEKLVATEQEIIERIPKDIKKIIELHDWYHPDVSSNEMPSQNETFKLISKVLETGVIENYKPTNNSNTHCINWPEGGTL